MAKGSAETEMAAKYQEERAHGSPDKAPLGVNSTLPEGMKAPKAEGEMHMGGVHKGDASGDGEDRHMGNTGMGNAVAQLRYETERGEHAPGVGGHADAGHHHAGGIMRKD